MHTSHKFLLSLISFAFMLGAVLLPGCITTVDAQTTVGHTTISDNLTIIRGKRTFNLRRLSAFE